MSNMMMKPSQELWLDLVDEDGTFAVLSLIFMYIIHLTSTVRVCHKLAHTIGRTWSKGISCTSEGQQPTAHFYDITARWKSFHTIYSTRWI